MYAFFSFSVPWTPVSTICENEKVLRRSFRIRHLNYLDFRLSIVDERFVQVIIHWLETKNTIPFPVTIWPVRLSSTVAITFAVNIDSIWGISLSVRLIVKFVWNLAKTPLAFTVRVQRGKHLRFCLESICNSVLIFKHVPREELKEFWNL